MKALSHKHRESQALVVRPHVFLSPFAVIWKLALMHWHRLHHKWHNQRSSDNKHGFPKFSTLFSHEATLSHERVPHWNAARLVLGNTSPSLIGLCHRASQQPWQLQQWLSLACFHYKPWHLISLREMGSERGGTRVAKPFSSTFNDALSTRRSCKKCLRVPAPQSSCFCPFCLHLKTQCSGCLNLCQRSFPDTWN